MGRARFVYDVYDNKTGFPIIIGGTSRECADALGITPRSFNVYLQKKSYNWRTIIKYMRHDPDNEFGSRLRKARMAAGLTQLDVARAVGVTLTTYKRYEQGGSIPNIEIATNIAGALNVSIKYLAGGFIKHE